MTEHLILSTIVLGIALLAARLLPLTARTRYAVILCGIAKFAIPTAVFPLFPTAVLPVALRTLGDGATIAATPPSTSLNWIAITWAAIATLLFARWLLLRTRTISAAHTFHLHHHYANTTLYATLAQRWASAPRSM